MAVVDGFLLPVPDANRAAYTTAVTAQVEMFRDAGALQAVYAWGADLPEGELTSFPRAVLRNAEESVVFGWVMWSDQPAREAGWQKVMSDPRMAAMPENAFDGKRMIFGGFDVIAMSRTEG